MIVGETTAGEAVEFSNVPLDGKILRVTIAQVVLPETGAIFPGGVSPDILGRAPSRTQAEIFALARGTRSSADLRDRAPPPQ